MFVRNLRTRVVIRVLRRSRITFNPKLLLPMMVILTRVRTIRLLLRRNTFTLIIVLRLTFFVILVVRSRLRCPELRLVNTNGRRLLTLIVRFKVINGRDRRYVILYYAFKRRRDIVVMNVVKVGRINGWYLITRLSLRVTRDPFR